MSNSEQQSSASSHQQQQQQRMRKPPFADWPTIKILTPPQGKFPQSASYPWLITRVNLQVDFHQSMTNGASHIVHKPSVGEFTRESPIAGHYASGKCFRMRWRIFCPLNDMIVSDWTGKRSTLYPQKGRLVIYLVYWVEHQRMIVRTNGVSLHPQQRRSTGKRDGTCGRERVGGLVSRRLSKWC